uniref:Uncharacterized protein n=1 Tax=Anopheles minimus TaxID=112268 RepID=A0A182WAW4_9DIPT
MSEEFDIYADLEHIESEAQKESQELCALKSRIQELQQQMKATEQEKADIIRKNAILLENVSSLLLTAKAEIKRKDTMISDLRRQCDNAAFGRKPRVEKHQSANHFTRFTQTPPSYTASVGVQTLPAECNDAARNKSKKIDIVTDSFHIRDRDRERERGGKSQIIPDRERYHSRDRAGYRDIDRHRDHERSRDRDRDRDSERRRDRERYSERDRDKYGERHRKRSQERIRHKEHQSWERGDEKETHDGSRKKYPKHNEDRMRNEARSSDETHPPVHARETKADKSNITKPKLFQDTPKCVEKPSESIKSHSRTEEPKDSKKAGKLSRTDSNNESKSVASKNRAGEIVSDHRERQITTSAISEYDPTSKESIQSSELMEVDSRGSETINQHAVDDTCAIPLQASADSCAVLESDEICTKSKQTEESSTATVTTIEHPVEDSKCGDQNAVPQPHDNREELNVRINPSETQNDKAPCRLITEPIPTASSRSVDDRLITIVENVHVSGVAASVSDASTGREEKAEVNLNMEHGTFPSDNETVSGIMINPSANITTARIAITDVSLEDQTESSKGSHPQTTIINEMVNSEETEKESSKGQSEPEPAATDLEQNAPCQSTPINDRSIPTMENSENAVDNSAPTQSDMVIIAHSAENGSDASQTEMAQEFVADSEAIVLVIRDGIENEVEQCTMVEDGQLPFVNDCIDLTLVSAGSTAYANHLPGSVDITDAVTDKQQNPSPNHDAIALHENHSHSYTLRDRRSNSCYSDVLMNRTQPPLEMSIQTYFMNFNVPEAENEVICYTDGPSWPVHCVEPVGDDDGPAILSVVADIPVVEEAMPSNAVNEIQKKPKPSTAEIVRERLRKRNCASLQKASQHSTLPMAVNSLKRRLSIDSASIARKRCKQHVEASADGNKLSVSPSGKLSSTYFSQIELPVTSALDSIPRKQKSPNIAPKAHDIRMTPMVVVHSPAKPSQDTDQPVQHDYFLPLDNQSSLQNIMDSLLQTPIKHESYDSVSPPSADHSHIDGDKRQNLASTFSKNMMICSTPLSTKPSCRFPQDVGPANDMLSSKISKETETKHAIKTAAARKEFFVASNLCSARDGSALNVNGTGKDVHENPSLHVQSSFINGTHAEDHTANVPSQKKKINTPTVTHASSYLNGSNSYKSSTARNKANINTAAAAACKSAKKDTAIRKKHPSKAINSTKTLNNVPQSTVLETSAVVFPEATQLQQQTTAANNNVATIMADKNDKLGEPIRRKLTANKPTTLCKRSRKQKSDDEKRTELLTMQSDEKDVAPVTNGSELMNNHENTQPARSNYHEVGQVAPQHSETRSNISFNNEGAERLIPQTKPLIPANSISNIKPTSSCKRSRKQKNDDEKLTEVSKMRSDEKDVETGQNGTEVGQADPHHPEARSIISCKSEGADRLSSKIQMNPLTQANSISNNKPTSSGKRSRMQKSDAEKRTELTIRRLDEKDAAPVSNGSELLNNLEQTQLAGSNYHEVEQAVPQHPVARTIVSCNSEGVESLNPQTKLVIPTNNISNIKQAASCKRSRKQENDYEKRNEVGQADPQQPEARSITSCNSEGADSLNPQTKPLIPAKSMSNIKPTASYKRSRKQKNDDEMRTELTIRRSGGNDLAPVTNGTELLNNLEKIHPEIGQAVQHHPEARSIVSCNSEGAKWLNPQTTLLIPANSMSSIKPTTSCKLPRKQNNNFELRAEVGPANPQHPEALSIVSCNRSNFPEIVQVDPQHPETQSIDRSIPSCNSEGTEPLIPANSMSSIKPTTSCKLPRKQNNNFELRTEVGPANPQHPEALSIVSCNSEGANRLISQTQTEPLIPGSSMRPASARDKRTEQEDLSQCVLLVINLTNLCQLCPIVGMLDRIILTAAAIAAAALSAPAPPPFSGPATPSAINILSKRINCGSGELAFQLRVS